MARGLQNGRAPKNSEKQNLGLHIWRAACLRVARQIFCGKPELASISNMNEQTKNLSRAAGFQPVYSPCAFGRTPLPTEGNQFRISA
jgi:hypothetical protein